MNWFTDQALVQCQKTVEVYLETMPISGKALARGVEWLGQAQRLRLDTPLIPFHAEERLLARVGEYGYGLDAPWPITLIEYEHGGAYDVAQDFTRALSTRRIALCVAISAAMTPGLSESDDDDSNLVRRPTMEQLDGQGGDWGSLLIWPVTYFDEKREWEFSPGVVIVPRQQGHRELALAANHYLAKAHQIEASLRRKMKDRSAIEIDRPMTVRYQPMLPELCAKLGIEHADKMIKESALDALWVVLGSYMAMSCENVFMGRDSRVLSVLLPDGQRCSLDPFRGKRRLAWNGRGRWFQETRTPLALAGFK